MSPLETPGGTSWATRLLARLYETLKMRYGDKENTYNEIGQKKYLVGVV